MMRLPVQTHPVVALAVIPSKSTAFIHRLRWERGTSFCG